MKQIIIEDNSVLEKFFRRNRKYEEKIINEIQENLLSIIKEKAYKIKTVKGYKYEGKTIYEYKIPLDFIIKCYV